MRKFFYIADNKKPLYRGFLMVFIAAFILRFIAFIFLYTTEIESFIRSGDSYSYIAAAKNLIKHQIFCDVETLPRYSGILRTPGYPFFLVFIYLISDFSNTCVVFIQVVLSALTCSFVYIGAMKYSSKISAFIVAFIIVFDMPSINVSNIILAETFFAFLISVFIVVFLFFLDNNKHRYIILTGLLSGMITLVKPIFLYSFIIMFFAFLYYFKKNPKLLIRYFLLYLISFSILIVPWVLRNKHIGYSGFSAVQELNIYNYKAGWIEERLKGNKDMEYIDFAERYNMIQRVIAERELDNTAINRVKLYKEFGNNTVFNNPVWLLKYQIRYTLKIFTLSGFEKSLNEFPVKLKTPTGMKFASISIKLYEITQYWFYIIVIIGIFRKKNWKGFAGQFFMVAVLAYFIALSGEYGGGSRFKIPILPFMAIISAGGFDSLFSIYKKDKL
jgi:4-amino-4-deoxy-L-arabinose transferase-like glycosyltransferase